MSVDRRMADALQELRERLGDGSDVEVALAQVAAEFDFQPEVLRARGEKAFGTLNTLGDAVALERARNQRSALVKAALKRMRGSAGLWAPLEPTAAFVQFFEEERDFSTSGHGSALAAERARCDFWRSVNAEIEVKLRNA